MKLTILGLIHLHERSLLLFSFTFLYVGRSRRSSVSFRWVRLVRAIVSTESSFKKHRNIFIVDFAGRLNRDAYDIRNMVRRVWIHYAMLPLESKNAATVFRELNGRWECKRARALGKTTEGSNVDAYGISDLKTLCCFRWASSHAPHPVFRIETIPPGTCTPPCPVSRVLSLRPIGILNSFSLAQNNFSKKKNRIKCAPAGWPPMRTHRDQPAISEYFYSRVHRRKTFFVEDIILRDYSDPVAITLCRNKRSFQNLLIP